MKRKSPEAPEQVAESPRMVKMLRVREEDTAEELLPGLPDHLATLCLARVESFSSLWGVCSSWQNILYTSRYFHELRSQLRLPCLTWLYTMIAHRSEDQQQDPHRITFSWYAFDPLAGVWHRLPPMPKDVRFELSRPGFLGPYSHSIQCTNTGDKLIVIAGTKTPDFELASSKSTLESALDSPLVFDVASATWSRGPRYTVARRWCTCGTARGKVLVASGCGNGWDADTARSAEVWDTTVSPARWRAVAPLASTKLSREATSAVDVAGRLHMASARTGMVFDAGSDTWEPMAPGMTRGWNGTCVASRGKLLVVDDTAGRIRAYDERTDSWIALMEDERLKSLGNVVALSGRICGSVDGLIRILELNEKRVNFQEIKLPVEGQVVGMQLLSNFISQEPKN